MIIPQEHQRDLLIYAFRYTLGRATYAPHTVMEVLKGCWPDLSDADRSLYVREIQEAIDHGQAGHECDKNAWAGLINYHQRG